MVDLEERESRRSAALTLGSAVRRLIDAHISTDVPVAQMLTAATEIDAVAQRLEIQRLALSDPFVVDDPLEGVRIYCPVIGLGNGVSPPVIVTRQADGSVSGRFTLSRVFEGPPATAHGGASAFILDQLIGLATASLGTPGLTRSLTVGYLKPVPLEIPLIARSAIESTDGRKINAVATIARADTPDEPLTEARGLLITVDSERAKTLFAARSHEYGTFNFQPGGAP
jgi:acyl-coenzyme A thioesterase PaaI-like protein